MLPGPQSSWGLGDSRTNSKHGHTGSLHAGAGLAAEQAVVWVQWWGFPAALSLGMLPEPGSHGHRVTHRNAHGGVECGLSGELVAGGREVLVVCASSHHSSH